jgi:acylphosphatase
MTKRAFHAVVEGRVQGVGFRYSCLNEARRLGLEGWVRNTEAGAVEVRAEGGADKLETLLAWLRKGPPGAAVRRVTCRYDAPSGTGGGFRVTG